MLTRAGCVAASEEADELIGAAAGDSLKLDDLVARRSRGEPIAYLTGEITFCDLRLAVEPGVYVPRWQTEPLARRAAAVLPVTGVAVDLCTGIGAIAAVLAAAVPGRGYWRPRSTTARCDAPGETASRCSPDTWTIRCRPSS